MTSRPVGRGPARPPAHRAQSASILRPSTVIVVGALVMALSGLVFLFGPNVSDPSFNGVLQRSRRTLRLSAVQKAAESDAATAVSADDSRGSTEGQDQTASQTQMHGSASSHTSIQDSDPQRATVENGSLASHTEHQGDESKQATDRGQTDAVALKAVEGRSEGSQETVAQGQSSSETQEASSSLSSAAAAAGVAGAGSEGSEKHTPSSPAKSPEEELYERMPIRQLPISHEMDDEELLWRASFISLRDPNRRLGPRKIAFLFSFTSQIFFAPLWAKFFRGHEERFSVYLHGTESNVEKATLPAVFHSRFVPTEPASTGSGDPYPHMFAVDAARRLVANALLDMSNEWFILVCDLCIPLHSFDYFYEYFSTAPSRNYVPHQTPPWKNGMDRFVASCYEPLIAVDQWRKGGPWIGLTRRMALNLVADIKFYDKFATCCLPAKRGGSQPCFPLEHYLATVLPILGTTGTNYIQPEEVTNWSMVFEDWWTDSSTGRPFVFNATLVSEKLIKTMRRCHLGNLCYLQGAHFDPTTLPMLMNMTTLLGY